jgi:hypothetical protein
LHGLATSIGNSIIFSNIQICLNIKNVKLYCGISEFDKLVNIIDLKIDYIFNTKRNKRCISIENYIFSESNHLKTGLFVFGALLENVL